MSHVVHYTVVHDIYVVVSYVMLYIVQLYNVFVVHLYSYNLLHPLKDNEEKESAFLGLFRMITFDPNQLENVRHV